MPAEVTDLELGVTVATVASSNRVRKTARPDPLGLLSYPHRQSILHSGWSEQYLRGLKRSHLTINSDVGMETVGYRRVSSWNKRDLSFDLTMKPI
jgi:hypothetical protein